MSEETKKKTTEPAEPSISMTDFKSIMQDLANAIRDSRKPFVDPRAAENDELFRQTSQQIEERKRKAVEADQASCSHKQGANQLSEKTGDLLAIAWHRYDDGVIRGICTNCIRMFTPEDKDYLFWFRQKSGNRISSAGRRDYLTAHVPQVTPAAPAVPSKTEEVPDEPVTA